MTNHELERLLRRYAGDSEYITKKQILTCLGISNPSSINRLLSNVTPINGRLYYVRDVSRVLLDDNRSRRGSTC